ncbi:MAG: hypothetical protein U5J82_04760 [Desulfobacterales bacterium]|nr:hypothetical protein [Desulfobacterales bacterium]
MATMIPTVGLHEHLEGPDGLFVEELKRDRFHGLGLGVAHESGHVGQSQALMFDAAKAVMKKIDES